MIGILIETSSYLPSSLFHFDAIFVLFVPELNVCNTQSLTRQIMIQLLVAMTTLGGVLR